MRKLSGIMPLLGALVVVSLVGCGGGGDAPTVNSRWDLKTAYKGFVENSSPVTYNFKVSGNINGKQVVGTSSFILDPAVAGSFGDLITGLQATTDKKTTVNVTYQDPDTRQNKQTSFSITDSYNSTFGAVGQKVETCKTDLVACSFSMLPAEYIVLSPAPLPPSAGPTASARTFRLGSGPIWSWRWHWYITWRFLIICL